MTHEPLPAAGPRNRIVMVLRLLATAFGSCSAGAGAVPLLIGGIGAIGPAIFTQMTPPPGSNGGLLNAIIGSLIMVAIATAIGTPTGILAGTFLAEYARGHWTGEVVRFVNDILLERAVDHHRPVRL